MRTCTIGAHPLGCLANEIGPFFAPEFYHVPDVLPWGCNEPSMIFRGEAQLVKHGPADVCEVPL